MIARLQNKGKQLGLNPEAIASKKRNAKLEAAILGKPPTVFQLAGARNARIVRLHPFARIGV